MPRITAALLLLLVTACGPNGGKVDPCSPDALQVRYAPGGGGDSEAARWLAFPWPSNLRTLASGSPDVRDFPNPSGTDLIEEYLLTAGTLDGFGLNAPVHLSFNGPVSPASIPTDPAAFLEADAPIQLVDVDPASPERGRRFPLRWRYDTSGSSFLTADSLSVATAWGFPLRPKTTYALWLTTEVLGADDQPLTPPALFAESIGAPLACEGASVDAGLASALALIHGPLTDLLGEEGVDLSTLAAATVFTTQSTVDDLEAIYRNIHEDLPAPALTADWQPIGQNGESWLTRRFEWAAGRNVRYDVYEGRFDSPNYQEGTVPYGAEGGNLHRDPVTGEPLPFRTESLRFVLTVPQGPPGDGGACYPIVEYAHGTGGSAYGFSYDTAGRLAGRGLAGIGLDQPLHGPRGEGKVFDVDMMSFNFLNPDSARSGFRQSAADTFSLTRFVRESLEVPATVARGGSRLCFDPDRVSFFGHSHGGLSGSLAAAVEKDIGTWVLSGAGGGLSITAMERKDPFDIAALVVELVELDTATEPLTELHPLVGLVQLLTEVTDPLAYSPYWLERRDGAPTPNMLVTSGSTDAATPWRTATAMAVAAGLPVMRPIEVPSQSFDLAGLAPVDSPARQNLAGDATGAFLQWKNEDHFVIFNRPEAIHASMEFLRSAAFNASPVIERVPNPDVK
ncbi:MAG: alpha/beta fold hydrolase [Deltaproteobacteria bacterium]|nr:alpha/beta fold hydrolase [Deltaproteobacteria bacterium]